jgi:glycosyltransferase involved in cell wall biosynthesis
MLLFKYPSKSRNRKTTGVRELRTGTVAMVVTNPFRPDERVRKEAKVLAQAGFTVVVHAWDRDAAYPTYEQISGFIVRRTRLRSLYSNFAAVGLTLPIFLAAVFPRILALRDVRVIHCHDLDSLPIGIMLKIIKKKIKLVYDAHEDYSSMVSDSVPSLIRALIATMERLLSAKADAVVTVSKALARKIPNPNVFLVLNAPEITGDRVVGGVVTGAQWPPGFRVLLYGYLGKDRGIETILKIAMERRDLSIVVAGSGPSAGIVKQAASKLPNVKFLGYVSQHRIGLLLTECQLVYALYDPRLENNRIGAPNKLYEAMMFGKPLLAATGSYMQEVVVREECGIVANYNDPLEIAKTIFSLAANRSIAERLGDNGRKAFRESYSWDISSRSLISCYDFILRPPKCRES